MSVSRLEAQVVKDVEVSVESRPLNDNAFVHIVNMMAIKKMEARYEVCLGCKPNVNIDIINASLF